MSKATYLANCHKKRLEREARQEKSLIRTQLIVALIDKGYNINTAEAKADAEIKTQWG